MTDVSFDTHALVKKLISGGLSEAAAEEISSQMLSLRSGREDREFEQRLNEISRSMDALRMELAQEDRRLEAYQSEIRGDLERMELRLKHELTLRLGGIVAVGVAALAALKLFA